MRVLLFFLIFVGLFFSSVKAEEVLGRVISVNHDEKTVVVEPLRHDTKPIVLEDQKGRFQVGELVRLKLSREGGRLRVIRMRPYHCSDRTGVRRRLRKGRGCRGPGRR